MEKNIKNGQSAKAASAQEEKGYIQVITKNNGKLVDFVEKNYKSVEQMNEDYKEFVNYYSKQYIMHPSDSVISFSEGVVKLDVVIDFFTYTNRNHQAREMQYSVGGYSVEIYKVEYLEG